MRARCPRLHLRLERMRLQKMCGVLLACACGFYAGRTHAQTRTYGYVPGLGTTKKEFVFAVWGDPQVAYYEPGTKFGGEENRRVQEIVVPRLKQAVQLTNNLSPEFVVTLGDNIHNLGEWENFKVFVDCVQPLQMPIYLLMGNHDHVPAADSLAGNPLGRREFANFIWAQKQLNGLELVTYSFDAGDWHLVMFSEPGGVGYGVDQYLESHPEFYAWLEADLQANQHRPTMFFTHHPLLPVGRAHFDIYGPGAVHRAKLTELLTRYGNVQYAFFGHVHNTVASLPYISWRYKGTAFIQLPNTAHHARNHDYLETTRASHGVALVKLNQQLCERITFHTLAGETVEIRPDDFAEYDDARYGYLVPEWELPAQATLRNGGFEAPLAGTWFQNHLLPYESAPQQSRLLQTGDAASGNQSLYLHTRSLRQSIDSRSYLTASVRQAVRMPPPEEWPVLRLQYKISSAEYRHREAGNAFIEIAGYASGRRIREFGLGYGLGRTYSEFGVYGSYASLKIEPVLDQWQELVLYPRSDLARHFPNKSWRSLAGITLVVTLGVFNENYTPDSVATEVGVAFDNVEWFTKLEPTPPTLDVVDSVDEGPRRFTLYQNYPNPFNPGTTLLFFAPETGRVSLEIYDLTGKRIAVPFEGTTTTGTHPVAWQAAPQTAAGIYWAVLRAGEQVSARKVLLLK